MVTTEVDMRFAKLKTLLATLLLAALVAVAAAQGGDFDVASGKQVAASRAPADGYPDPDGLKLTDGSFEFAWGDMVGWEGPDTISLVIDLGSIHETVSYVALKLMRSDGSAVALPASAIVSI